MFRIHASLPAVATQRSLKKAVDVTRTQEYRKEHQFTSLARGNLGRWKVTGGADFCAYQLASQYGKG